MKRREARSYRENRAALRKIAKQGLNLPALQHHQPWQSPLVTHHSQGAGKVAGGQLGGYSHIQMVCRDTSMG